ncbi:MAG: HTH-type transcriptional regulator HdfR [Pseudomonadota bacterium]|jgi:DNA-binding transcriptional LysR family regulator
MRNLDMDVLRSVVALDEHGTLAQAGERVGRTQAALSLQMRRLEETVGEALFSRDTRRLEFTEAGRVLVGYARRILALNDEAQQAVRATRLSGELRFGASQDFGEAWLPPVLAQFRKVHPSVGIEVRVDGGTRLVGAVDAGEIDMALALGLGERAEALTIGHLPLVWVAHRDFRWVQGEPLPLVLFTAPCRFRNKGVAALDAAGISWKVALTSPGLHGVWAAVNAGLGVTVRTPEGLLPGLEVADRRLGLPDLGNVDVSLHVGRGRLASPAVASLAALLRDRLAKRILELEARTPLAAMSRRGRARFAVRKTPQLAAG